LAGILFPITGWLGSLISFILAFIGFNLQRICSPDLDVDAGFYGFFLTRKKLGNFFGKLYQAFWYPYALLFPHRGLFSHSPVLSSLLRLTYLFFIPIGLFLGLFHINLLYWWDWWIYLAYGVIIADLGHLALDFIPSFRNWYEN
jgi:uncharacterized metal-binding protein